jgi:hypothetical protein
MFFSISKTNETNFPNQIQLGDLVANLDMGWEKLVTPDRIIIYKGYAIEQPLKNLITQIVTSNEPKILGNFCLIDYHRKTAQTRILHGQERSFPLFVKPNGAINNIDPSGQVISADCLISLDSNLNQTKNYYDLIGLIDTDISKEQDILDAVYDIIEHSVKEFLRHNQKPLKIFLSGGIDSMLVFSFIKKLTDQYEIIAGNHIDFDYFWCHNGPTIQRHFWAYAQIHHWRDQTVLSSGAPGDEFMLRSPMTGNLYLMHHGTSIMQELLKWGHCLHAQYFMRPKMQELFEQQRSSKLITDRKQFFKQLCDINLNDMQHWHIGNTLTFTPLRDIRIFKLLLQLPLESAIAQILDSSISRKLIARNDADLLNYLSVDKNIETSLDSIWPYLAKNIAANSRQ